LAEQAKLQAQALKAEQNANKNKPATAAPAPPVATQSRQQLTEQARPLKNELKKVDERMASLNTERDQLNARLCEASVPAAEMADKGKRLRAVEAEIETLEGRWLELTEAIEALANA